jgi:hypothetical protein
MEKMIGRYLRPDEVVHHMDGDKTNDIPSNLLLTTNSEHIKKFHAKQPQNLPTPDVCRNGHVLNDATVHRYTSEGKKRWRCRVCDREAAVRRRAERNATKRE